MCIDTTERTQIFFTSKVEQISNGEIILAGDWNTVINPNLDYHNHLHVTNKKARDITFNKIHEHNLLNGWRQFNETRREYTWRVANFKKIQPRLDFFLV